MWRLPSSAAAPSRAGSGHSEGVLAGDNGKARPMVHEAQDGRPLTARRCSSGRLAAPAERGVNEFPGSGNQAMSEQDHNFDAPEIGASAAKPVTQL